MGEQDQRRLPVPTERLAASRASPMVTRAEFLRRCLRMVALGALATATGALLRRAAGGGPQPNQTCRNRGVCRNCAVYATCGLPQALSRRRVETKAAGA